MANAAAMTPGNPTEAWAREELARQRGAGWERTGRYGCYKVESLLINANILLLIILHFDGLCKEAN